MDKTGGYAPTEGTALPDDLFLSSIATLSNLEVNGGVVSGFAPNIYDYTVEVAGSDMPMLSWTTTSELATVINNNPTTVPNTAATIEVTAQDGFTTRNYAVHYIGPTHLEERDLGYQVQISPNPASDTLTIVLGKGQVGVANIFSADGKNMRRNIRIESGQSIDVSHFPKGVYILSIQVEDQKTVNQQFKIK